MRKVIHQYKLRLTNLSQRNRSLKLGKLSPRRDIDLMDISHAEDLSAFEILEKIIAGKRVTLLKSLSSRQEWINKLDLRLNKIYREVSTIFEETGAYDLFIGYPWVEGKFLEDSIARCPVMLFPVRLVRDFQKSPRWRLEVPEGENILFNKTFFLAYEKFQKQRLSDGFWDEDPEHFSDAQSFLNYLYDILKAEEFHVHFNPELYEKKLRTFSEYSRDHLDNLPLGKLKFSPNAVLGIFPQSDSSLLQDYEELEKWDGPETIEELLAPPKEDDSFLKKSDPPETKRHIVVPIDESQERALLAAKKGHSIVVHGPPGTGKSQLILNLVADSLAAGKRVLVCSQKRAALDVVYQRLAEVGLSRFAGLVHDFRSDRKRLFEQVKQQVDDIPEFQSERIDGGLARWEREFQLNAREIELQSQFFQALYEALSTPLAHGLRPHDLYQMAKKGLPVHNLGDLFREFSYESLLAFLQKLGFILSYREFFADSHPWRTRPPFDQMGLERRKVIQQGLAEIGDQLGALSAARSHHADLNDPLINLDETKERIEFCKTLQNRLKDGPNQQKWAQLTDSPLSIEDIKVKLDSFNAYIKKVNALTILPNFSRTSTMDLVEHWNNYRQGKGTFTDLFSLDYLKGRWYIRQILADKNKNTDDKTLAQLGAEIEVLHGLLKLYQSNENEPFFADFPLTDTPAKLKEWYDRAAYAVETAKSLQKAPFWEPLMPKTNSNGFDCAHWDACAHRLKTLEEYATKLEQTTNSWKALLHSSQAQHLTANIAKPQEISDWITRLVDTFQSDFEDIRALDELLSQLKPTEKALFKIIEPAIGPETDPASLPDEILNDFFLAWIESAEESFPALREPTGRGMPARMATYRDLVEDRQKKVAGLIDRILKDRIVENIEYNRLNNPVTYRGISHQVNKKRRIWSVRKLVDEFWHESLSRLIPCWMASPESVSAIFPMARDYFDLVIFDEASQCFVERAFPVMLRGKNVVIAGDAKQLRPLDLYRVKVDEDEEGFHDDQVALEVESALDLSRNIFEDFHLTWHYRSLEEELINFSNHAFYAGSLNVIPPASIDSNNTPIDWHPISGKWEKNRNLPEAIAIVDETLQLIQQENAPSVGIVTFNYHQQDLIKDLFDKKISELSENGDSEPLKALLEVLDKGEDEERQGIFVKNIENVQGDERDVIIFSVGYAADERGKIPAQFGLLNLDGGENRLNVAITRARKRIKVFCSFDPELLRVENATHSGPKLLKQYLLYARAVGTGDLVTTAAILERITPAGVSTTSHDSLIDQPKTLADTLEQALTDRGVQVVRNVGDTNYKVDLAIVDPQNPGKFILGIECEGPMYFSGNSAKEREVYRWRLLEKRGWKMYRAWSRNYFLDPQKEIDKILSLIKAE